MKPSQKYFWLLLGLSAILFFPGLGKTPLWIYDEVRNAECAREMYERGDWIVPTFNGGLRTLKPPLHYYFMFAGFELFGINEWGARFFSALFGVFTIICTWFFIKKFSGPLHAFVSSLVLLASSHFLFQFRMSVPDPYLIFLNTFSVFSAYAYFREKKFFWLLLCAIAMGLGTLAKGPVSILLPGGAVFIWLIWEKRIKEIWSWKIVVAGLLLLAVALPWYWLVHRETNGEWTRGFFFEHNIGRFSGAMEGHGGLFIIVPLFVLLGLLPASVFIGESLRRFRQHMTDPLLKLCFCVMMLFILFYSISGTKLPNYPMPCYPFVAVLLGYFITRSLQNENKPRSYPLLLLLIINIALPIGGYLGIRNEVNTRGLENIALFLLLLTAAAFLALYYMQKKKFRRAVLSGFILYTLFNLVLLNYLYPVIYRQNPLTLTIDKVKKYERVVAYQIFHPSFTYYLPDRVKVFKSLDSLKNFMTAGNVVVISRDKFNGELESIGLKQLASVHDLFEGSTTVLYSRE